MQYRIELIHKQDHKDPAGLAALADIHDLGVTDVADVRAVDVFLVDGELTGAELDTLVRRVFLDPVVQQYRVCGMGQTAWPWAEGDGVHAIEVKRKPGVMDPVQASAMRGAADAGLADKVELIRTARKFLVRGELSAEQLDRVAWKALGNAAIEEVHIDDPNVKYPRHELSYDFELVRVPLRDADDAELMRISSDGMLSLTLDEMKTVQGYFGDQDRDPTDLELEILAQTWSEHCVHKTLKGYVTYEGPVPETWQHKVGPDGKLVIDNMLKETIARATLELDKPWCVSVFVDNAGVIEFNEDYHVCFKVETHNHPSALEPYGGANTGIGGVIRDPMGTGLGARPIANTDVFCFGLPDMPDADVPPGALHPRRVMRGVVGGVRDYGNRMGIPTVNGAVYFDERYTGNPLVYCGNIGLIPVGKVEKAARPGDLIVVVGGRTGRDGIHGATFSSIELTHESEDISSGAVQIGDAIQEKKVLDTLIKALELNLYTDITDCGAGGLSSSVGEMAERTGARVEIGDIPLKYDGLSYTEIWISEAQERMVIAVPPENLDQILAIFASEDVEATVIGAFTDDLMLTIAYNGNQVASIGMKFLHEGLPRFTEEGCWEMPAFADPLVPGSCADGSDDAKACARALADDADLTAALHGILSAPNVRSKEWIVRQYDHEVQGQTVVKPLVGVDNDGPGDAAVLAPILGSHKGIALACGLNPLYNDIDAYHGTAAAMDEALRNLTAVGVPLTRATVLDNFCWGNTRKPEQLGSLVRASLACYDCAVGFGVPFISGKDSLNNEFNTGTETIAIPPTLLISAMAVIDDVRTTVTMDLKEPGNRIYLVGATRPELGGSHYLKLHGLTGTTVPQVNIERARKTMETLHEAIQSGLVRACHDLSEGGLAVAAAEMAFAGNIGICLDLNEVPWEGTEDFRCDPVLLFSESCSRFLVEIPHEHAEAFDALFAGLPGAWIGETIKPTKLKIGGLAEKAVIEADLAALKASWQTPLVSH